MLNTALRHARPLFLLAATLTAGHAPAQAPTQPAGINLEGVEYPYPVSRFAFESQGESMQMAYMDVAQAAGRDTGATVLLLHGKNFNGAYFGQTITALSQAGYRVLVPDQIGFGKSTKPAHYQYSFHQLAANTAALLDARETGPVFVFGHSMGGMLAARFALEYPERTRGLILTNPIGLEDWRQFGVPYQSVEQWYRGELGKSAEKVKAYQRESYYDGQWRPAYDRWVDLLTAPLGSPDYPRLAWNQALAYDMIFTQPVVHEFGRIQTPTLLIIGTRDRTALGKNQAPDAVRATMGRYDQLGKTARDAIPGSTLVEFDGVGHLPHIEAYDSFIAALLPWLNSHAGK